MWFVFALITTLSWGAADLFYKRGADENDKYSHLKTAMAVGLVMGIHAFIMLIFTDMHYNFINIVIYLPVSLMYILSMVVGYFGLKYLELSISSPIQNSSGALTAILCFVILKQTMDVLSAVGVVLACAGVFVLGIIEKREQDKAENEQSDKKYVLGFAAFMIPVIYCIIDALGTFFDAYYLDDISKTPFIDVTEETFENVANTSYELTFFIMAVCIFVFLKIKKQKITLVAQRDRTAAAVFETAGQITYVFALSGNGIVAAPMISSYCIVSLILSRIFLGEKLTPKKTAAVCTVIAGIIIMGIAEGTA
ncbi:MAG: DMT family transporter [Clostridiales bacterium]|nr:DMT family transporter [Clostridiales bacterium]